MAARTGAQFLAGLRDERRIWVDGRRVTDVTTDHAFAGAAKSMAGLFDLQHAESDTCLIPDEQTGEPINASHMIPRSREDLARRHACLRLQAEHSMGLMGRSPDYLNVTFAGFAANPTLWSMNGNGAGAENLVAFQKELRRRDLSMTHTIIHPTIDRSSGDAPTPSSDVSVHKVDETADYIVVRGSRILATLAPFADELAVYPSHPLPEGSEAFGLAFSIPISTPGLTFLCRDSFSRQGSLFDHPLSSRFDEQDAIVIFDDVKVPKVRLFIDGNLEVHNRVLTTTWTPNICQQTMIRAHTKLQFAHELGTRMAEALNDKRPQTAEMLGEIWCMAEFARSALFAAEAEAREWEDGAWFPDPRPLVALRATLPQWFPRVNEILQLIGSHNLLAVASSGMLAAPELRPLLDRYLRGAGDIGARERSAIFRLGWDFSSSALGNRGELYERFYLASGPRNLQVAQGRADRTDGRRMVDRLLAEGSE
ncbi:MAG TPA: 4-hydroxyphenylacetate 3-hydroxylase N-terminal domain-containing protein [Tepidiformaceae bacterium]|nr:4-hydroxyphenylacetate 3-hydroxylase N-terminal domain-containing protein [Tepidiformaceae bacterium]